MLSTVFAPLATHPVELFPARRRPRSTCSTRASTTLSTTASTRLGSHRPAVYERAVPRVPDARRARRRLADGRFLFGSEPLETDWRLFTTLVRFDAVYQIHFKCSIRKLAEYQHLWPYLRDLYQWPGVAATVDFNEIRDHYYRTHPMINPSGLVAMEPAASFDEPAGRA